MAAKVCDFRKMAKWSTNIHGRKLLTTYLHVSDNLETFILITPPTKIADLDSLGPSHHFRKGNMGSQIDICLPKWPPKLVNSPKSSKTVPKWSPIVPNVPKM